MDEFKKWKMKTFNRHCGNCRYNEGADCMVPIKRLDTFKGAVTEPLDRLCTNTIASYYCKWKRKK